MKFRSTQVKVSLAVRQAVETLAELDPLIERCDLLRRSVILFAESARARL